MDKIELGRKDLQRDKKDLLVENVTIFDFKGSVMSREEMNKAEKIIFVDGNKVKILKNRFGD